MAKRDDEYNDEPVFNLWTVIKSKKGLIIAGVVVTIILLMPIFDSVEIAGQTISLDFKGQASIALLVGLIIIFLTESLPIGATVGIVYAWVIFFGIFTKNDAAAILSSDAVWFLIGSLMIAQILIKFNLHKRFMLGVMKVVGTKTTHLVFGIIAFCAIAAAFIADHLIAAMMLPLILIIIEAVGGFKKVPKLSRLLLFAVAYGATIGGIGTPSGGGRNVIMMGIVEEFSGVAIGYGTWMLMAFPMVLILIPMLTFVLLKRWKPEVLDLRDISIELQKEMKMQKMGGKEIMTLLIFSFILFMWIFYSHLGIGMITLLGAVLFLAFGLAEWSDYNSINWNIPMLYFGAIGLGTVLKATNAAQWLGAKFLIIIGVFIPIDSIYVLFAQTIGMALFTETMAAGPAAATLGPVLVGSASLAGIDVVIAGVAIAVASSFAFLFVIGTPPNAIIYGSGYLKPKDFLTTGIFIELIAIALLWLFILFWWPFVIRIMI